MFRYVIKERCYELGHTKERTLIGSNSFEYIDKAYRELLMHQELKQFEFSWFTVDQYENNVVVATDIMF